jgi:class 3 adenylate cyclase
MQETLKDRRLQIKNDFNLHEPLRIRIGIHSGVVVLVILEANTGLNILQSDVRLTLQLD